MSSITQYTDLFAEARTALEAGSCAPMNARRDEALQMLAATGLPSRRAERYKYADVEAAFAPDYGLNLHRLAPAPDNLQQRYRCNVSGLGAATQYVIGDVVVPMPEGALPEGVVVTSICQAAATRPELIVSHYASLSSTHADGIAALNTLLCQDGVLIYLPAGTSLPHPLQILCASDARRPLMANRRILVIAETGAEATILLCDHAFGSTSYLTTQVVEAFVGEGAKLQLFQIEETSASNTRFANVFADVAAGGSLVMNSVALTTGISRTTTDIRLSGEGAYAETNGAVIADASQYVDHNVLVDHAAPLCKSDMLFKYVLDGESTGAFAGKVLVREGAVKTESAQTNANIVVRPTAHAYSQPMLEIYADDVKCNHGSTIGKLDEAALFYMRQRGIPEAEARLLLQHAFINDVLGRISIDSVRERLSHLIDLRFRGELSKCRECAMCH